MDTSQDIERELNTFLSCINSKSNEDLPKVSDSLKELRALMRVYQNQESLRKKLIDNNIRFFNTLEDLKTQCTDPELTKSIFSFGLQLAVNCMVSNSANKEYIFKELVATDIEKLDSLLNFVFREPKLVKFFAMLMNSVVSDFEKEKVIESWKNLQYRFLIHKLLGFFFHEEYSGKDVEHSNDDSFEWFYYLISNILNLSNYLTFFQTEKSILKVLWKVLDQYEFDPYADWNMNDDIEKHIKDKNKLRFLYFMHNAFEKTIGEKSQTSLIINYTPKNETIHELYDKKKEHGIAITIPDFMFIIDVFNRLSEDIIQNIQSLTGANFENLDEIKPKLNETLDYFHAILKLFCQISFLGGYNKIVQEKFFDNGSFSAALKTLQVIYQLDRTVDKDKPKNLKITDILHEDGYFELYLNFLRLTSNIVHINVKAQDYIYDNDYLLLLLSFTVVDQNNPYIREWSIILIKNLTENNPRIQERIAQMKVVDFDSKTKELLKKFSYEPDPTLLK